MKMIITINEHFIYIKVPVDYQTNYVTIVATSYNDVFGCSGYRIHIYNTLVSKMENFRLTLTNMHLE